jgi:LPS-assembly protein
MHKLSATFVLLTSSCATLVAQSLPASKTPWLIEGDDARWDFAHDTVTAKNVVVKYGDAMISANNIVITNSTGDALAQGNVGLQYSGQVWLGESVHYNFFTKKIIGQNLRTGHGLYFSDDKVVVGDAAAGVYVGADAMVTADDYAEPSYHIQAKSIVVVPGEYLEAHRATLYLGKVPVFYLPYYRTSLKNEGPRFEFTPGYRSQFGPYLLTTYHAYRSEEFKVSLHADYRIDRGPGVGPDFKWNLKSWGDGELRTYYAHDNKPGLDNNFRPIDPDRYRLWFAHQAEPLTNFTLTGVARYQSDPTIVRDFFESEYKRNVQPSTFVEANKRWANFSVDLLAQPRLNNFYETVERLPDVKVTGFRQQLGSSPFYYESDSSFGYYHRRFAAGSTNEPFAAARADTFHQITLPYTVDGFLNFIPRVGGRYTYYGEASDHGGITDERNRGVFNTGAELNFKASRLWADADNKFFQIDGLRHIIQPSINYSFVPRPSVTPHELPQFDYQVPTTRLLPIEFPDFNAIDAIDSQSVLRLGLRNKIQTRRNDQLDNLLHWSVFTDWRLSRTNRQDTFSDLYSDLDLKPWSWLTLSSELRYNMEQRRLNEAIHQIAFTPGDRWSLGVGHRYLHQDISQGITYGDDLLFSTLYYRFNQNWAFRMYHQFQALDRVLEEQDYTMYRDFRSWTGALTFRVRDNRTGPIDYTVAFTFSFKVFPRYKVNDDQVYPTRLLGY